MVRFGLSAIAFQINDFLEQGLVAEAAGFDSIWIADHFTDLPPSNDKYEPWTVLATIGAKTERILLGTLATDCVRYHPTSIAHIAATLDNLSRGRVIVGIGAGEAMNIRPYGLPWDDPQTRLARLKETVQAVRLLWKSSQESPVDLEGRFCRLSRARLDIHPFGERAIPIYIAALGSRAALRLVGEIGDGWLPWFNTPELYAERVRLIDGAGTKVGRASNEIEKTAVVYLALTEDRSKQKKILDSMKAEIVVLTGARRLSRMGYVVRANEGDYSYQKCFASDNDAQRARQLGSAMSDTIAGRFLVAGSPKHCVDQLEELIRSGAQHLIIRDTLWANGMKDFHSTLALIGREIIPVFS